MASRCLYCKRKIGFLRRLAVGQYCSRDHLRKAQMLRSARLARDMEELGEYEDAWALMAPRKKPPSFSPATGLFLIVVTLLVLVFLPSGGQRPSPPPSYMPATGAIGDKLSRALPWKGSLSLREDFKADLRNWQGPGGIASAWGKSRGSIRPHELRLWKPTVALSDYQVEFEGKIEAKALSWAYRAPDTQNYYATKLSIAGTAEGSRAEIVRFTTLGGHEGSRVRLPIPLQIREKENYHIRVAVEGSRFTTYVNGRLVDSWSDKRLKTGGVGFFSEAGEMASIQWVSISEQKRLLHRLLMVSFLVLPQDLP